MFAVKKVLIAWSLGWTRTTKKITIYDLPWFILIVFILILSFWFAEKLDKMKIQVPRWLRKK
ncbi:MAG: hypothetical protein ACTSV7_10900 [Candidatus Baldrarchaeia archaeon]